MRIDELLGRLDGVTTAGADQWNARCPAHDDHRQSLSVSVGDDRLLLHCHTGCALGKILLAAGLDWRDIFNDPEPSDGKVVNIATARSAPTPVRESRRRDKITMPPEHIIAAWVKALEPWHDRIEQRKGWTSETLRQLQIGWDGVRIVIPVRDAEQAVVGLVRYLPGGTPKTIAVGPRELYPAPETVEADDVWLVEGEPDRITAHELGLQAVAVPGVATWKLGWAERFRSKRVTVMLDCDQQGRDAARQRVDALALAGVEAAAVDLAPDTHSGYDLGDAFTGALAGARVADLQAYLARLRENAWRRAA